MKRERTFLSFNLFLFPTSSIYFVASRLGSSHLILFVLFGFCADCCCRRAASTDASVYVVYSTAFTVFVQIYIYVYKCTTCFKPAPHEPPPHQHVYSADVLTVARSAHWYINKLAHIQTAARKSSIRRIYVAIYILIHNTPCI